MSSADFSVFPRAGRLRLSFSGHLDGLSDAVGGGRVDLLASLGNLGEDGLVGEGGDDLGVLVLEGDFVALDAWEMVRLADGTNSKRSWDARKNVPSSFLRTRSMAPEQPPQVMVTLNS